MNLRTASVLGLAGLGAVPASASVITGATYSVPETSDVVARFASQSAGATGSLYYLGWEYENTITFAPDSDATGLGQFLFSNHGTPSGYEVPLGIFEQDATLHFAYLITDGRGGAIEGDIFRSDVPADLAYYALQSRPDEDGASVYRIGLEDIRGNKSDRDYNDVKFDLVATPVPSPGAMALAGLGMALSARRRRR